MYLTGDTERDAREVPVCSSYLHKKARIRAIDRVLHRPRGPSRKRRACQKRADWNATGKGLQAMLLLLPLQVKPSLEWLV